MSNILKLDIIEFIKSEGKKAFNASDYTQAINHYHKALKVCDFIIPEDDEEDDIGHATLMATMSTIWVCVSSDLLSMRSHLRCFRML